MSDTTPIETDFLIVGAGPAGASLAAFLASYGLKGIVIAGASGTADTPRAHITNAATMECLRDLGVEAEAMKLAIGREEISHVRWCASMAGEEFARVYAFGLGPERMGEYRAASPCEHVDIPQTLLEPILVRYATNHGFKVRFDTFLVDFEEAPDKRVVATFQDRLTQSTFKISTKYLFGADGARSTVVKKLGLPLTVGEGGGSMFNVLVKADLSHLMGSRKGDLHWVMQPGRDESDGLISMCCVRMVKPWNEWMFILLTRPDVDFRTHKISDEQYLNRVREVIGDDTPVELLHVSRWVVNETYANTYSKGNVFCLGDAVHRHPPARGLGSNTCIQDAYNLAWKVAYVEKGLASRSLLDTYSVERQPVGKAVVEKTNTALRVNGMIWEALGTLPPVANPAALVELKSADLEGRARRDRLREGLRLVPSEYNGLGLEMGQRYKSAGVYLGDEDGPRKIGEKELADPILHYEPSTYPGSRLPHAWLNKAIPGNQLSTLDLAGHGAFVLLTGIGGEAWKKAAESVTKNTGVPIKGYSIGYRQDWEDVYSTWYDIRGVEESGAVLVRPDRVVAWRAQSVPLEGSKVAGEKLEAVVRSILSFN
ncbi:FAD binding domain-containing protein [Cladorrhinum sp. PSN259]|nr:FAD binding domain-containing protein [Cladorrhinum sp. PSN259]